LVYKISVNDRSLLGRYVKPQESGRRRNENVLPAVNIIWGACVAIVFRLLNQSRLYRIALYVSGAFQEIFILFNRETPEASLKNAARPRVAAAIVIGVSPLHVMRKLGEIQQPMRFQKHMDVVGHETVMVNRFEIRILILKE